MLVTAVYEFGDWPTYYGHKAGKHLGLMTIYCNNSDSTALCPSWVTAALPQTHGVTNSSPATAGNAEATTAGATTCTAHYPQPSFRP